MENTGHIASDGIDSGTWEGLAYLESVSGPGAVAALVGAFIRDAGPRLLGIQRAIARGDTQGVVHLAHDLKANAGTIGANRLTAVAMRLEGSAPGLSPAELESLLRDAEREVEHAILAIQARLQAFGS